MSDESKASIWKKVENKKENPKKEISWRIATWFPDLAPSSAQQLKAFHGELLKFNLRLNLISRNTENEADEVHFADCLIASQFIVNYYSGKRIFDFGSGNGFPGIVLAITEPSREFVLVESDLRKAEFLRHVSFELKLRNVSVLNERIEALKLGDVEFAVSRGLASISKTLLTCNRVFEKNGTVIHLKGVNWSREIGEIPPQLISIWSPGLIGEYALPVSKSGRFVVATQKKA